MFTLEAFVELSARPYLKLGIAATMAGAIALSPIVIAEQHQLASPAIPHVTVSQMHLAAAITPADIAALVANLNDAMAAAGSTVTSVIDSAGHTLTGALTTAAGLNETVWDGLIGAAGTNPTLVSVLVALKAASSGGLTELSGSVGAVGEGISLTTGQISEILTSAVTGTLGTALQAVANIVNDPLAVSSYINLLGSPFSIAGLAIQSGITAVETLGSNGLRLGGTLVHGVTAQISNALAAVNDLLGAGKTLTDIALVDGALTAIQGIVSAPVTAVLAGVNGITDAVTTAGVGTLSRVAGGANAIVGTWLGSGSAPGAVQAALARIGSAPLSPASYTHAVSILVSAAASTVGSVVGTASSFASLPFRVGADLAGTGAEVVNAFVTGLATAASGILQAAGLSPIIAGLPHNLATAVTAAVNVAALAARTTLNTIAGAIDLGQAIGGIVTSLAAPAASAATDALGAAPKTASRPESAQLDPDETASPEVAAADVPAAAVSDSALAPAPPAEEAEPATVDTATDQTATPQTPDTTVTAAEATPTQMAEETEQTSTTETPPDVYGADPDADETPSERAESGTGGASTESTSPGAVRAGQPRHAATGSPRRSEDSQTGTSSSAETYGRHAAPVNREATATPSSDTTSSTERGRHRRGDAAPQDSTPASGRNGSEKSSAAAA